MDVTVPGLDGPAATRRIRASGSTVPILMITGRDAVGDRIVALDNGADGYLMKPFAPAELLARAAGARSSNTLDVYVVYLRRKPESRGEPRIVQTVRGLGCTLRATT
jgi:DNA-binding response OmpR family regulator